MHVNGNLTESRKFNQKFNNYNVNSRTYEYKNDDFESKSDNESYNIKNFGLNNEVGRNTPSLNNSSTNGSHLGQVINHPNIDEKQILRSIQEENDESEYHFQSKIRNSGYWGKVNLRRGTWLVIIGIVLMSISVCVISVFWRWWYGPEINMPCRVIGITLLVLGFLSFIIGLLSNWLMLTDPLSKHFIGSPPRLWSWILLASIISLILASDLMTIYYTYWHNRYVNTPLISISFVLYFFGSIGFIVSILKNINQMKIMKKGPVTINAEDLEKQLNNDQSNEDQIEEEKIAQDDFIQEKNIIQNDQTETKKNFRNKIVKITPRNQNQIYLLTNQK
jgi:hypothetical protein